MIKSVRIKNKSGQLILHIICRKGGKHEMTIEKETAKVITVEVRNETNQIVRFGDEMQA